MFRPWGSAVASAADAWAPSIAVEDQSGEVAISLRAAALPVAQRMERSIVVLRWVFAGAVSRSSMD